jgi:oligopeptide/dipeptide ABC transporter ATP-binding protein
METHSNYLLKVENLSKKYIIKKKLFKKEYFKAVDNVSFDIKKNEIVGLVGESGSGKSTIGKLILKLIQPDEGRVIFKNKDIFQLKGNDEKYFRKETSVIFQDPRTSLNPRFKIYEILEEPLIIFKYPKKERDKLVRKSISDAGLDETFLNRYPSELSGGQRQRVAIARAIILNPEMIVADEPTSALDVTVQLQIINLIQKLKSEKRISFLFISHDLNVVGMLSERIVVLYRGKIMEKGNTQEVLLNPAHPYTKLLIQSLPPDSPKKRKDLDKLPEIEREDIDGACVFYHRCPIAQNECKVEPPMKILNEREVYCYFV